MDRNRKPKMYNINLETLQDQINNCIVEYCDRYNIDLYDYKTRSGIKHNEVNNILRYCYNSIFKPSKGMINNQKSIIDYDDIEQLEAVVNIFIDICSLFNKSLGMFSFCLFSGIDDNTVIRWNSQEGREVNSARWELLQKIKRYNQGALVSLLKDSPVGALAVANNDAETGLQWSINQAAAITNNTVYILPTERDGRLQLKNGENIALPG